MEIIYENSFWAFFFVTLLAGGGAAFAIGRATAKGWNPFWQAAIYTMMLGVAIRFLHFGLFAGAALASWRAAQGNMHSPHYYVTDTLILLLFAALGFRLQRRAQMLGQYGWLAERSGLLGWRLRDRGAVPRSR
jgi:hypothetical protein